MIVLLDRQEMTGDATIPDSAIARVSAVMDLEKNE